MPKYLSKDIIEGINTDYASSNMTVQRIATKYNISIRSVYTHVKGKAHRGHIRRDCRSICITKEETEALLLCILKSSSDLPEEYMKIIKRIETRLLDIADELTVTA